MAIGNIFVLLKKFTKARFDFNNIRQFFGWLRCLGDNLYNLILEKIFLLRGAT